MGGLPVYECATDNPVDLDALARARLGADAFVPRSSFAARDLKVIAYIDSPRGTWVVVRREET